MYGALHWTVLSHWPMREYKRGNLKGGKGQEKSVRGVMSNDTDHLGPVPEASSAQDL
jgi:hypothetical protein